MKRIVCLALAVIITAMLCIAVGAKAYNPQTNCNISLTVKKADPANVVKDGIIGDGEYERAAIDTTADETSLAVIYGDGTVYDKGQNMLSTMEYYFSWDETHGFNIAVVAQPEDIVQNFTNAASPAETKDDFLSDGGMMIDFYPNDKRDDVALLYYAIGKNPTTGEYLKGCYNQLGNSGAYNPTAGVDFAINYTSDGKVVYEWSVPFSEFLPGATTGSLVHFSVGVFAGTIRPEDAQGESMYNLTYGIGLGDFVFLGDHRTGTPSGVKATLSGDVIEKTNNDPTPTPDPDPTPTPTPNPTPTPDPKPGEETVVKDDQGNTIKTVTNADGSKTITTIKADGTTTTTTEKAPQTGDPMVIAALVSAVSACGIAVVRRRRG